MRDKLTARQTAEYCNSIERQFEYVEKVLGRPICPQEKAFIATASREELRTLQEDLYRISRENISKKMLKECLTASGQIGDKGMSDNEINYCCPIDDCTPTFQWGIDKVGYGTVSFENGDDGEVICENEGMSKETIKKLLCHMVDNAEFIE